jgi:hypothetical protein
MHVARYCITNHTRLALANLYAALSGTSSPDDGLGHFAAYGNGQVGGVHRSGLGAVERVWMPRSSERT